MYLSKGGLNIPIFAQCFLSRLRQESVNTPHLCYHNDCICVAANLSIIVIISAHSSADKSASIEHAINQLPMGTKIVAIDVGKLKYLHEPFSTLKVPPFENTPVMFWRTPKSLRCI